MEGKLLLLKLSKKISIRNALILSVIFFLILPVILTTITLFRYARKYLENSLLDMGKQITITSSNQMRSIVENINYSTTYLTQNNIINKNFDILNNKDGSAKYFFAREDIINLITEINNANLNSLNGKISLITLSGDVISQYDFNKIDPDTMEILSNFYTQNKVYYKDILGDKNNMTFSNTRPIIKNNGDIIGYINITVPSSVMETRLITHDLLGQGCIKIVDTNSGQIVLTNNVVIDINEKIVITDTIDTLEFTYEIPRDIFYNDLKTAQTNFYRFFVVFTFVLLLILIFITFIITKPIHKLVKYINKLKLGKFEAKPPDIYFKDINILSDNLEDMAHQIDTLIQNAVKSAQLKEQIYFEALTAQINPHFLYNTLNSIRWMAILAGNDNVSGMITELSKILGYVLNKDGLTATLGKELEIIESYIKIQKMRYGDTFKYVNLVDEKYSGISICKFILQPLVENAIEHGVFAESEGQISISALDNGSDLIISVADNGKGMSSKKASELLSENRNHTTTQFSSIGLNNVNSRIKIEYGEIYGLNIISEKKEGCIIEIHLPYSRTNYIDTKD